MAIAWNKIKPAIQLQMSDLSGLDSSSVRWVDEPSGLVNGILPVIWLRVSSVTSVGCEEERYNDNGDGTRNMCGVREFTLGIRCESFTADIADDRHSGNIIERIKIRLWRSSSVDERAGLFAIRDYAATKWFSYIADGRPIQTHMLDLFCITVNNDTDISDGADAVIEEALVSGPVKDTSGNTLGNVSLDINAK